MGQGAAMIPREAGERARAVGPAAAPGLQARPPGLHFILLTPLADQCEDFTGFSAPHKVGGELF